MTVILGKEEVTTVFVRRVPGHKFLPYDAPKGIYDQRGRLPLYPSLQLLPGSGALTSVKSDGWCIAKQP